MFLNPIWSILLLLVPVAVYYFVIRPRLRMRFTALYARYDAFWERAWARIYAFRTFFLATAGALLAAAPDILVAITPLDFSKILPQPWGLWVGTAVAVLTALMKAFETKPREEK